MSNEKYTLGYAKIIIAKFMELDFAEVGYADSEEETEWQRNHEEWMNGVGLTQVGRYFVNVKENRWHEWGDVNYHSSWLWLMPLLNADNTPCTDPQDVCYPRTFGMPTEDGKQFMFRFNGFITHEADTLIEAAHKAVFEVAYFEINQQKQKDEIFT